MILDEPTAGMDPHARRGIMGRNQCALHDQGITILCATHFLDEATRNADDIVVMHKRSITCSLSGARKTKKDFIPR